MRDGYFSPDSIFWRINREGLLGLSGLRALLLEVAHPLVAAGVAEHSDFRRNPWKRLYRTIRTMTAISFQPARDARKALGHTARCHAQVQGQLAEAVGPYPAGTPYRADDPALQFWVLATLVDSVLVTYDLLIEPLSSEAKEEYYAGARELARAFRLPADQIPADYAAFQHYMALMVDSATLTVGPTALAIAQALFNAPVAGPLVRWSSLVSVGLLPERLRADFNLRWGERDERRLQRLAAFTRRLRPRVPDVVCVNPRAWLAERQWRRTGAPG